MASITTWTRLETRQRTDDLDVSLAARVHDPLWLLARQWQLGELRGHDSGTPVGVVVRASSGRLARYLVGNVDDAAIDNSRDYDDATAPLEAVVEAEPLSARNAARLAVEAGRPLPAHARCGRAGSTSPRVRRRLRSGRGGCRLPTRPCRGSLPRPRRPAGTRRVRRCATGLPHPAKGSCRMASTSVATSKRSSKWRVAGSPGSHRSSRRRRTKTPGFQIGSSIPSPSPLWSTTTSVCSSPRSTRPGVSTGTTSTCGRRRASARRRPPRRSSGPCLPAPVTFPGMPAPRFWAFEDARIDLGAVGGGADDIARMLLIGFSVDYGNDWFVVPVELPVGSITAHRVAGRHGHVRRDDPGPLGQ